MIKYKDDDTLSVHDETESSQSNANSLCIFQDEDIVSLCSKDWKI